ncbi:MAG: DNA-protecting protein DprA [Candidatus Omnitrophica bacterium]|nr:hypothetical protein [bacterium]NUN94836.1 DNA-protecting protein DprA [Candidatus Omnitrophota bacterium]
MSENSARADWLRLVLTPGVGPSTLNALITAFGSPDQVLGKSEAELSRIPKISPKAVKGLLLTGQGKRESEVEAELALLDGKAARILLSSDPDFPPLLREIPVPPRLLFARGRLPDPQGPVIAVVGTRRCDSYGLKMTREIVTALAGKGIVTASGLALGIDGAAHRAALAVGGQSWAFLPCGFGSMYPCEHAELAEEIAGTGGLFTEFHSKIQPHPRCFPVRNRLVSGCARGVLVVQAPMGSGALITARHAMEQNRDVYAVPGRANEPPSEGPHRLIQDGAKLVCSAEDILSELRAFVPARPASRHNQPPKRVEPVKTGSETSARHPEEALQPPAISSPGMRLPDDPIDRRIVLRLEAGRTHIDRLAGDLDLPVRKVSERLLLLEMQGLVRRLPGMSFDLA